MDLLHANVLNVILSLSGGIDTICDDFLEKYWDYDKNTCDPFELAMTNQSEKIWIKCQDVEYHGSYETKAGYLTATRDSITCPYCYNTRVHKLDSLGYLYPEVLPLWSDKNKRSPYEYKPKSGQKVWFKCNCGKHSDTLRSFLVHGIITLNVQNVYEKKIFLSLKEKSKHILMILLDIKPYMKTNAQ